MSEKRLTVKQKRFCEEYIKSGNATEAARQAGYRQPNVQGPQNLVKLSISNYLAERMMPREKSLIASADEVLQFYSKVMRGEIEDRGGVETSVNDRLKAADALQKRYSAIEDRLSMAGDEMEGGVVELPQVAEDE